MTKLTALIEAAKEDANLRNPDALNGYGDTILELCALLEKAEDALAYIRPLFNDRRATINMDMGGGIFGWFDRCDDTLAAIKQWKEQI